MDRVKEWSRWVYDWITVLSALVFGIVGTVDLTPLVGPETALKIVTAVAVLKGIAAFIENRRVGSVS